MLLNNEAVLHIIEAHFADAVEYEILTSIMGMDGYDLSEHFDELVDYGDLGGINEITVTEFEFEKDGGEDVNELTVYNICNTKEQTKARRYSGEKLKSLRTEIGLEGYAGEAAKAGGCVSRSDGGTGAKRHAAFLL